jgi:hypothetical protein
VYVQTIYCSEHLLIGCSTGRMQPLLPHGTLCITVAMRAWLTQTQHCIFSWLKQESSQEKCPMCRQRTSVLDYQVLQLTSYLSFQIEESRRAGRHRDTRPDTGASDQPAISPRVKTRTTTLLEQHISEQCAKRIGCGGCAAVMPQLRSRSLDHTRTVMTGVSVWMIPHGLLYIPQPMSFIPFLALLAYISPCRWYGSVHGPHPRLSDAMNPT